MITTSNRNLGDATSGIGRPYRDRVAGMEFTGVLFMPEYFQLISTSASKYVLVTGDDDQGRDVLDPESMKDHLPLVGNKDFKHRDILLNPERTRAALAWAEDFLDSL